MARLHLITFDLDDTLWPVNEVIRRAELKTRLWIEENHPDTAEWMTVERIRRIRDELLQARPDYIHNLTALRTDAMTRAFRETGHSETDAQRMAAEAFEVFHHARNEVVFFPGALEVLETLADSYTLGALSNGNADLRKIGIADLFAFHHRAETVGRGKPAPDMFHAALRSANVRADQALHVGDHPEQDVHAARREGMHAVWANLLDNDWPQHLEPHAHRIHNLHELTDLIPLLDD